MWVLSARAMAAALFLGLLLAAGCGSETAGTFPGGTATPEAEPATSTSSSVEPPANDVVGEAMIGSAYLAPDQVIVSEEAAAFVPLVTVPAYRVAPERVLTEAVADEQADQLGLGEPRTYDTYFVSDERWILRFRGRDPDCFTLEDTRFDADIMAKVHAGESLPTLAPEEVRAIADTYLESVGYGEGLQFEHAGVRDSVGTATLGGESRTWVISMFATYDARLDGVRLVDVGATVDVAPDGRVVAFSHTVQKAEPAEHILLRPVEDAIEDMRAGHGQCPVQAKPEGLATVTVETIELAYYAGPPAVRDDYYRPVYVFHALMANGTRGEWILSAYDVSTAHTSAAHKGGTS